MHVSIAIALMVAAVAMVQTSSASHWTNKGKKNVRAAIQFYLESFLITELIHYYAIRYKFNMHVN
jgi:hypothetical protein